MADAILPARQPQRISQDKQAVYQRHALRPNSNTIRILDVQPVPRDAIEGTPVKCTLRIISLDRGPDFTALSYVWGDPEHKRNIVCDGVSFQVTENCYSALWHLSKKLQGLVVWVDAICIDQENKNKEKEWQIPLMGDIYTKARQVYIWLGRGDKRSDQVMRYMSKGGLRIYVQSAPDEPPRYRPYAAALRSFFAGWSFGYHPLPFQRNKKPMLAYISRQVQYINWNDLIYVLDRPWKGRIWTYQEILLASHPVIVCGTEHVEWSDFEWTLLLLSSTFGNFPSAAVAWESIAFDRGKVSSTVRPAEPNVLHSLQEHERVVKKIIAARRTLKITWVCLVLAGLTAALLVGVVAIISVSVPELGIPFRLPGYEGVSEFTYMALTAATVPGLILYAWFEGRDLFQPYRGDLDETTSDDLVGSLYQRASTDPRDMAYGIWAILRKRGATSLPRPAYDTDIETQVPLIYRQLTVNLIQVTGNVRFLYIAAARRLRDIPSWVPDWSTFKSNTWRDLPGFPGIDLLKIHRRISSETKEMVKKERAHQRVSIDPTHSILIVLAQHTGTICDSVSFRPTSKTYEVGERNAHLENMRAMLQWADWAYDIGCKVAAIFYTPPVPEVALEVTPLSAGAAWPSWRDRTRWGKLLAKPRRDRLNVYLTRWMDGVKVPRWFLKFMATQICLCTLIAELKRKVCYVSISDEPGKFSLLACSEETQVDDRVIRVCGLPSLIVVRKRGDLDTAVRIISPTARQSQGAGKKAKSTNDGSSISLENRFVEYHIH